MIYPHFARSTEGVETGDSDIDMHRLAAQITVPLFGTALKIPTRRRAKVQQWGTKNVQTLS
ncbi:hypothetical protein NECAME_02824 [Necator americanus]|uniref:Uncharacterized protein n=1 Tax=Necator americanus TaxID=51031 RepID=W2TCD8_NECAM|nr:hypothetical protein NECAME_02824 [Necator americanus]ETN78677.1 hypothetical protein NECAME_02824 [Necator americanus]